MHYSAPQQGTASRGSKVVLKQLKLVRSNHIHLESTLWVDFICAYLRVHNLADQFNLGFTLAPHLSCIGLGQRK